MDTVNLEWIPEEQQLGYKNESPKRKRKKLKQVSYEFPRMQEENQQEVMQAKLSQNLFNPNEPYDESTENELNDDDEIFDIVINGLQKDNLEVLPLPDKLIVPRKKGRHTQYFSVGNDNTTIRSLHNDDCSPWNGKPRTKNYVIKNEGGKLKANVCKSKMVTTHGQCYFVKHGKYAEQNINVVKKIYSATTPSSPFPAQNTLIVIVYDIEKDLDISTDVPSSSTSPSIIPRLYSLLPQKRSFNTLNETKDQKITKISGFNVIGKNDTATSSSSSNSCLLGFDKDTFFNMPPLTSPTTSKATPSLTPERRMRDYATKLKETEENLRKEVHKKEENSKKYNDIYGKWYKLRQLHDEMNENLNLQLEAEVANSKLEREQANDRISELLERVNKEKTDCNEKIEQLENEVLTLKGALHDASKEHTENATKAIYEIKSHGQYIPKAKLTMARLINMGVAVETVGPVMGCVAEMFGYTLNAIPSARTVAKSPFLTQSIIKEQLRRTIIDAEQRGIATTYCSDETKKGGVVWQNEMFTTLDELNHARSYCLGNVPVITKASDAALDAVKNVLESLNSNDGIDYWETFILNIGNRMSDEAATEKAFTNRVEGVRRMIINNQERFDHLTEEQKDDLAKLRSFYCQLHVLQNLTPVVTNVLLEQEKELRGNINMKEPTILTLLKLLSKHLGNRGASRYTSNTPWNDYCKNNNISFGRIPDFVGNRFNILFAIASCVFFLRKHIIDFIEKFNTDLKQTPVLAWLKDPIVVSHLHLLSAYNLYITAPLLRLTEYSTSISTLAAHASSLIEYLEKVKQNPLALFTGHAPFEEYEEAEEVTNRSLAHVEHLDRATRTHPEIMVDLIEELAEATVSYFKKKFNDYLPGGVHYSTSADIRTVPRHNKGCEHNFGLLTWDYHHAPNKRAAVRAIRLQAIINKTFEWWDQRSPEEKERILNEALLNASKLEKDAAESQKAYENARWNLLLEKQREYEITTAIKTRKETEANQVVQKYGGCWTSLDQMNAYLDNHNQLTEKRKAVEAQLKLQKLLPSTEKGDTKLCVLTMCNDQGKRVPKPMDILIRNLQILIVKKNVQNEEEEDDDEY